MILIIAAIFIVAPCAVGFGWAAYELFQKCGITMSLFPGFGVCFCVGIFVFFVIKGLQSRSKVAEVRSRITEGSKVKTIRVVKLVNGKEFPKGSKGVVVFQPAMRGCVHVLFDGQSDSCLLQLRHLETD